jgi:acyl-coenzyme A thioesterase PaaI-like protein
MPDRIALETGSRFMTAPIPDGLGIQFYAEGESVVAPVTLNERYEGPPQHVHGGFSAAFLDELMGTAVWRAGYQVVAVNIQFNLRLPVPLGVEILGRGWVERVEGRKVFTKGDILLPDGQVAVEGAGIFVEAAHLFPSDTRFTRIFKTPDEP